MLIVPDPPSRRIATFVRGHTRVLAWATIGIVSTASLLIASAATSTQASSDTPPPPATATATSTATNTPTRTATPSETSTPTATATFTATSTPVRATSTPPIVSPPTRAPAVQPQPAMPTAPPAPPPPPTYTPVPPPPPPAFAAIGMDTYSRALFNATNARRASVGAPPLRENGYLNAIAKLRSDEMAKYNYFSHVSPITGENVFALMDRYGVPYGWAGENLAKNNYPDAECVQVADQALWDSPSHYENIVNLNYTDVGIALTVDAEGMKYFTIVFTGPP